MSLRKHPATDPSALDLQRSKSLPTDRVVSSDASAAPDQPMGKAEAVLLKALAEEAADPEAFDETLTRAEAARRIVALKARLGRARESGIIRFPRT